MLEFLNEDPARPGFGSLRLDKAKPGDRFGLIDFTRNTNGQGYRPSSVHWFKIVRVTKTKATYAGNDEQQLQVSLSAPLANAVLSEEAAQWAVDAILARRDLVAAKVAVQRALDAGKPMPADLLKAIAAWSLDEELGTPTPTQAKSTP